jgi:hypothetical protein
MKNIACGKAAGIQRNNTNHAFIHVGHALLLQPLFALFLIRLSWWNCVTRPSFFISFCRITSDSTTSSSS